MYRHLACLFAVLLLPGCPGSTTTDAGADAPVTTDAPVTSDAPIEGDAPASTDAPVALDAPVADGGPDAPSANCAAQEARAMGSCDLVLGVLWTGSSCAFLSGCTCVGADCGALYPDRGACLTARAGCTRACGGRSPFGSPTCEANEFCAYTLADICGRADAPGVCTPRPPGCPDPGGTPVCGCDGVEYPSECDANLAGVGVLQVGGCPT